MRVTKYPQSCLVVEHGGSRVLIDPGTVVSARFSLDDLGDIDAMLITHRHADHVDPDLIAPLRERSIPLFGNADVAELLGGTDVTVVGDGEPFTVAGMEAVAHDLPHVPMLDGSAGPPNTGFVLDGHLFHPGDGMEITGLRAAVVATPISGPSISFREAYAFVQKLGAGTVIPIHYDVFAADPEHFARVCDVAEVVLLDDGGSVDV